MIIVIAIITKRSILDVAAVPDPPLTATVTKFTKIFFTNFDSSLLVEWEFKYQKIDKKTVGTKLRETKLKMTNHNLEQLIEKT